jgi:hypothetical protein
VHLRTSVTALTLVGICLGSPASGQSIAELPPVFMGSVQAIPLPEGDGAWVLQIVSRGGFTGRGAGDLVLFSDGRRRLRGAVTESMPPESLTLLTQRIRDMAPSRWVIESRLRSRCNDCVATLVVLTVREPDGTLRSYSVFWDTITRARIPTEVLQIHDLAVAARPLPVARLQE